MSRGHACEIERLHGECPDAMSVWELDHGCIPQIFPRLSQYVHFPSAAMPCHIPSMAQGFGNPKP